jgi:hypothetical protein
MGWKWGLIGHTFMDNFNKQEKLWSLCFFFVWGFGYTILLKPNRNSKKLLYIMKIVL